MRLCAGDPLPHHSPGARPSVGGRLASLLGAASFGAAAGLIAPWVAPGPTAAAPCPGAEVVFARGREEPPGPGYVGNAFVNALRPKLPTMTVASYGVNYPADISPAKGADDMSAHVQSMAHSCPETRMVLGGYSLGAAAADLVIAVAKPAFGFTNPLPPAMADHIAAVALFGNGTRRIVGPLSNVSPAFAGKTIDQCAAGDPICSNGTNWPSHFQPAYIDSGLVDQAAGFAAGKL
ncbi:cutinase family protein [Mycobacterium sp. Lab-001]|uniref:cutinase family protein n=1 Tax=Mycobacterium sp. Lab-001 TaxID=3410136 RepID=UPI003D16DA73